jgi:hypothetical protein
VVKSDVDTPSSTGASPVSQETWLTRRQPANITYRNQSRGAPPQHFALKPLALGSGPP